MPPTKRSRPYQKTHDLQYGVHVSERDPKTSRVLTVACRFCEVFGKELSVGSKRARTSRVKLFRPPFRTDNYTSHHATVHGAKWKEYLSADPDGRKAFFDTAPSLHAHYGRYLPDCHLVDRDVVDVVIMSMLMDPDEDEKTKLRVKESFVSTLDQTEDGATSSGDSRYRLDIANTQLFSLVVKFLSSGLSFRQVNRTLNEVKSTLKVSSIGFVSEALVGRYARYLVALSLQMMKDVLSNVWAFSLALDMSTLWGQGYLDVRIRVCSDGQINDMHMLTIPIHDRHTGEVIFDTTCRMLDVVVPGWRDSLVGCSSDGEAKMAGRISGVSSRFQRVCPPGFMRVWCAAHQADIHMQAFNDDLPVDFKSTMTTAIGYLRRQQNLTSDLGSKCPKLISTRWSGMLRCTTWFDKHRIKLLAHFESKTPACTPPPSWWVVLAFVKRVSQRADIAFKSLQGRSLLLCNQRQIITNLVRDLGDTLGFILPLTESQRAAMEDDDRAVVSSDGTCGVFLDAISDFIDDSSSFVARTRQNLPADECHDILVHLARSSTTLVHGINAVVSLRDTSNLAAIEEAPPVLPQQLAGMAPRVFTSTVLQKHRAQLEKHMTQQDVDAIEEEHLQLRESYQRGDVKDLLESFDDSTPFQVAWHSLTGRFPRLYNFVGGLATIFPTTATVESDFSVFKWEKDEYRQNLLDVSLEGVMHSKQYEKLKKLAQVPDQ